MMNRILFFCILIIGLVSVYDTYISIIYSQYLGMLEQNPIGKQLLKIGGLVLFIEVKAVCTVLSVLISFLLVKTKYRLAIIPVLLFQVGLFFYLNFYTYEGFMFSLNGSPISDMWNYYMNPNQFVVEAYPEISKLSY